MRRNNAPPKKEEKKPKPPAKKRHAGTVAKRQEAKQKEELESDRMYPLQAKHGAQEMHAAAGSSSEPPRPPNIPVYNFGRSRCFDNREYSVEYYSAVEDHTNADFPYMKVNQITAAEMYPPVSSNTNLRGERSVLSEVANQFGFDGVNVQAIFPEWWRRHQTTYDRFNASGEAFLRQNTTTMHVARRTVPPNNPNNPGGQRVKIETRSIFGINQQSNNEPAQRLPFQESTSEMSLSDSD